MVWRWYLKMTGMVRSVLESRGYFKIERLDSED